MVGLALEGGGAKGAYQIGAYLALKAHVKNIDMIAGTSIGAINAAMFVQGDEKLAIDFWTRVDSSLFGIDAKIIDNLKKELNWKNIAEGFTEIIDIIKNKGIDTKPLRDLLNQAIDEDKVRNSKIKFGLITIRLSDFTPLQITIDDIPYGKLNDYLLASCYLPVFKSEKIIDDKYYLDGGFYNNLPVSLLEDNGCDLIYAIRLKSLGIVKKYKGNVIEIKPNKSTGPTLFFDKENVIDNIKMGYYDTLKVLGKVIGKTYYFKKKKLCIVNVKNVKKETLNIIKLKYDSEDYKEILFLAIEEVLHDNKYEVLKLYEINKILRVIKDNKLKAKSSVINDFILGVNCIMG